MLFLCLLVAFKYLTNGASGLGMKALVAQYDHLIFDAANHRLKDRIVHMGCVPI